MARGTGPQKWLLVAWECPLPLAALLARCWGLGCLGGDEYHLN